MAKLTIKKFRFACLVIDMVQSRLSAAHFQNISAPYSIHEIRNIRKQFSTFVLLFTAASSAPIKIHFYWLSKQNKNARARLIHLHNSLIFEHARDSSGLIEVHGTGQSDTGKLVESFRLIHTTDSVHDKERKLSITEYMSLIAVLKSTKHTHVLRLDDIDPDTMTSLSELNIIAFLHPNITLDVSLGAVWKSYFLGDCFVHDSCEATSWISSNEFFPPSMINNRGR